MADKNKSGHKKTTRLLALVLCLLLALTTVVMALVSVMEFSAYAQEEKPATAISIAVAEGVGGARVTQQTAYVNLTGKTLNEVLFAIAANSLRRFDASPFENENKAYPAGFTPGGIDMRDVYVNGQTAAWGVRGDGENILGVEVTLQPGETCAFTFEYDVLVPESALFLGSGDMGWRLSFFYPCPCVYDAQLDEFRVLPLKPYGSFLFSDAQDYEVTVDMPETWLCAHGGSLETRAVKDGRAVETFTLTNARDLALALGRKYSVYEKELGDVKLRAYTNTRAGAWRALNAASQMIAFMTNLTGDCPIARLTVAQAECAGAHDGLIYVDTETLSKDGALRLNVYEAVAKQWFGLSVASDPELEPWLSDSLCRYLALLCVRAQEGEAPFLNAVNDNSLNALKITLPGSLEVDSPLTQFQSVMEYDLVIRGRGPIALNELRLSMGDDAFFAALKSYYADNQGAIASISHFASALNAAAGHEMDYMLMESLRGVDEYVNQNLERYE